MKRVIVVAFMIFMSIVILATNVFAENLQWTLTTVEGEKIDQDSFAGKTVIVVFSYSDNTLSYRMAKLVQSLIDADWPAQEDIQVIIADVNENSAEVIKSYFFPYFKGDMSNLIFTVDDDDGGWNLLNLTWDTLDYFQGGNIPLCAIIRDDQILDAWESNMEISEIEEKLEGFGVDLQKYEPILGDVNGDQIVDAQDLTGLAKHLAKIKSIESRQLLRNCDVNLDGNINSEDLTKMAKYVAKIIPEL